MRILFSTVAIFLLWSPLTLGNHRQPETDKAKKVAKEFLEKNILEPNIFSPETLEITLQNIEILESKIIDSQGGRIWCDRPVTYELTTKHPIEANKEWKVIVTRYKPRKWHRLNTNEKKTVIVTPATGGEDSLEKNYSWYLCDWKLLEVVRVASWEGDEGVNREREDIETEIDNLIENPHELSVKKHDRGAVLNIAAIALAAQFTDLLNTDLVAGRPLGILGNSVGGIASGMTLSAIPRIKAGVLIVAGAPLHEVIATSGENSLAALRQLRMEFLGLTIVDQYIDLMEEHILLDPFAMAEKAQGKNILMITAGSDSTVPSKYQDTYTKKLIDVGALVEEIHLPNKDHTEAIAGTLLNAGRMDRIGEFFKSSIQ